jgi:hypothetical protein
MKDWLYSHAPRPVRDFAGWLVLESGWRLGRLAPIMLGLAMGSRPHKLTDDELEELGDFGWPKRPDQPRRP